MVTVIGARGMLGSVVLRRWRELGDSDHVIDCHRSESPLADATRSLAWKAHVVPSTDAIREAGEYAGSKRLIEQWHRGAVIRAGIVDLRKSYTHANWSLNPLTPLEWADLAWEVRDQPGLHIDGREPITRYELGLLISEVFGAPRPERTWAEVPLSRVQIHGRERPPMRDALIAYRDWLEAGAERERLATGHA